MSNESRRHMNELADSGDRLSRRASVYHMLLADARKALIFWYELMEDVADDATLERESRLITRIASAMAADDDELRAIRDELTDTTA